MSIAVGSVSCLHVHREPRRYRDVVASKDTCIGKSPTQRRHAESDIFRTLSINPIDTDPERAGYTQWSLEATGNMYATER